MNQDQNKLDSYHPLLKAEELNENLQTEIEFIMATTNAEEELTKRKTEIQCASTSAIYKQIQLYSARRKEILRELIKAKKEYIEALKQKIREYDAQEATEYTSYYTSEEN
ncbi:hypothetical protein GPJ56_005226 [Histomonas meleagridis]|uniref:uncharacterized protein n=1 Tax=Histomonas meleagridis TaxID=135588 RepID=UPI00355A2A2C|nr:hypothetical protein GPJ56_005226 [Histomonas meleagridis]KAH0802076.1 hypothetical protein GO595_005157 [Histomonas meleagridis]